MEDTLPTALNVAAPNKPSDRQSNSCADLTVSRQQMALRRAQERVLCRFKTKEELLARANRDSGVKFARNERAAFVGDYPTLTDIRLTFGGRSDEMWLLPQIANISAFSGAKLLDSGQQQYLAQLIATEYHYLKITELLLFFYKFACGEYGKFYGSVDPMVVMQALHWFQEYRASSIDRYEQEDQERAEAEYNRQHPPLTREQWEVKKDVLITIAMYNSDYTTADLWQ